MKTAVLMAAIALAGCGASSAEEPDLGPPVIGASRPATEASVNPRLLRRFRTLRTLEPVADNDALPARVALGKQLFFDPRLSRTGDVSCNTCHPLDRSGADGKRVSIGVGGAAGRRNAPTV